MSEVELVDRLKIPQTLPKNEVAQAIEELGRRGSTNAVVALFSVLTFDPSTAIEQWETGGRLSTYEGRYPAVLALSKIPGVSVGDCVDRLKTAKPNSKEEVLLVRLATLLDRETFQKEIERRQKAVNDDQTRWQRIANTYLSSGRTANP